MHREDEEHDQAEIGHTDGEPTRSRYLVVVELLAAFAGPHPAEELVRAEHDHDEDHNVVGHDEEPDDPNESEGPYGRMKGGGGSTPSRGSTGIRLSKLIRNPR